ncbi:MAG: phosphoribosyl-ATP diphosphatase [Alphaproteobacteria bacterium]
MTTPDFERLGSILTRLAHVIETRRGDNPSSSYVASKLAKGAEHCAKKVGEEAVEVAMAAVQTATDGDRAALVAESADLLFHLLVLWAATDVTPDAVAAELERREGVSGHAEKAARPG